MLAYAVPRTPGEDIFAITLGQRFQKQAVFPSTNRAYIEQIVANMQEALRNMDQLTLETPGEMSSTFAFPNYSAPRKVDDNLNRVLIDGEWLNSGGESLRLESIHVLKTRTVMVWPYWWVWLLFMLPPFIHAVGLYVPREVRDSLVWFALPLIMMFTSISLLGIIFIMGAVSGAISQLAYCVVIKHGPQRIIVYTSMYKTQADLVREAIVRAVQARQITVERQPSIA